MAAVMATVGVLPTSPVRSRLTTTSAIPATCALAVVVAVGVLFTTRALVAYPLAAAVAVLRAAITMLLARRLWRFLLTACTVVETDELSTAFRRGVAVLTRRQALAANPKQGRLNGNPRGDVDIVAQEADTVVRSLAGAVLVVLALAGTGIAAGAIGDARAFAALLAGVAFADALSFMALQALTRIALRFARTLRGWDARRASLRTSALAR